MADHILDRYLYDPCLAAAATFAALFGLSTALHLFQKPPRAALGRPLPAEGSVRFTDSVLWAAVCDEVRVGTLTSCNTVI